MLGGGWYLAWTAPACSDVPPQAPTEAGPCATRCPFHTDAHKGNVGQSGEQSHRYVSIPRRTTGHKLPEEEEEQVPSPSYVTGAREQSRSLRQVWALPAWL